MTLLLCYLHSKIEQAPAKKANQSSSELYDSMIPSLCLPGNKTFLSKVNRGCGLRARLTSGSLYRAKRVRIRTHVIAGPQTLGTNVITNPQLYLHATGHRAMILHRCYGRQGLRGPVTQFQILTMSALVRRNPRLELGVSWRILYTFGAQYVWCSFQRNCVHCYKLLSGA